MQFQSIDWRKGIVLGAASGILWGWIAIGVNVITSAFPFEQTPLQHIITFGVGGAVFGIVVSGFLNLLQGWLPFKSSITKGVYIAIFLWIVLFGGAYGLALTTPDRYNFNVPQAIQGLVLAVVLGIMLGYFWKRFNEERAS
ncbi:MAG: hypothetical protein HZC45_05765 [Deltaproteobacteria bacterium]|nr:hypothetical protein [Deltaproteobacteria bacterium]